MAAHKNKMKLLIGATLFLPLSMSVSFAQADPDPTPPVDVRTIPVLPATASPTVGEEVLDQNGVVASAQFIENRVCTYRGCRRFIFDKRSGGALVLNDGVWTPAYARTGRGGQVIRVLPFADSERPGPAPDDSALENSDAIISVTRGGSPVNPNGAGNGNGNGAGNPNGDPNGNGG